jgi:hypothetical protein
VVGKETLDPCFTVGDGEHVACEPDPLTGRSGILVRLTEPLPLPDLLTERPNPVWLLQLPDATVCRLAPGVTGAVGDKRITYLCGAQKAGADVVILGDPRPGTVWLADLAELALQDGKYAVKSAATVPLRVVVRGPLLYVPADCAGVADTLAQALGADVAQTEAPFADPLTGQAGLGCQVWGTVAGYLLQLSPGQVVTGALADQGWREEMRYRDSGPARAASAFRRADVLCLLNVAWEPAEAITCAACQPAVTSPRLAQGLYTVALNCGRDLTLAGAAEPARRLPERIVFAPGATAASLSRSIATGQIQEYILRALAGQTMILEVTSPQKNVFLSAYGDDGAVLLRPGANARRWLDRLPTTQDYRIKVAGRGETTDYTLSVVIPVDLKLSADARPAMVKGIVEPHETMYYLLPAAGGQQLTMTVTSPERTVLLDIVNAEDGEPLVLSAAGLTTWTAALPRSAGYILQAVSGGARAEYVLEVAIR